MPTFCRNAFYLACLAALGASVLRLPAQARQLDQSPIHVDVNLVMLDATVKTKAGEIMTNLKKDDFQVREDGVVQKLEVFSRDELPLNVALVLDLSDSIGPFLGPLRDAANTALAALKPDDEVRAVHLLHRSRIARALHQRQEQNRRPDQHIPGPRRHQHQ